MDSQTQLDTEQGNTNKPVPRSRAWFFTWQISDTINTKTKEFEKKDSFEDVIRTFEFAGAQRYAFQLEEGEKTLKEHFQGIVYFENARSFNQMKQIQPKAH